MAPRRARKQQPLQEEQPQPDPEPQDDERGDDDDDTEMRPDEGDPDDQPPVDDSDLPAAARLARMAALRKRMVSPSPPSSHSPAATHSSVPLQSESAQANRRDLIDETSTTRANARNAIKLERKRKQAEAMGEKAEARETGEDLERKRAWEYSIEDNEKWDKKVARKGRRADFTFTGSSLGSRSIQKGTQADCVVCADYDDIARRKYKKVLRFLFCRTVSHVSPVTLFPGSRCL